MTVVCPSSAECRTPVMFCRTLLTKNYSKTSGSQSVYVDRVSSKGGLVRIAVTQERSGARLLVFCTGM